MRTSPFKTIADLLKMTREVGDCLEWTGARTPNGYGHLGYQGRDIGAHRLAWMLANGRDPGEGHVLHSCDNRPCINPAHLSLGTALQNARDKMMRGRGMIGAEVPGSVLTREAVTAIREEYARGGTTYSKLGLKHGVSMENIHYVVKMKTWK